MAWIFGKYIEEIKGDDESFKVFIPKLDKVVRTTNGEEIVGVPRWQGAKFHLAQVEGAKYAEEGYEALRIDWNDYKVVEARFLEALDHFIQIMDVVGIHLDRFKAADMINAAPEAFEDFFDHCKVAVDEDYYVRYLDEEDPEEPEDPEEEEEDGKVDSGPNIFVIPIL